MKVESKYVFSVMLGVALASLAALFVNFPLGLVHACLFSVYTALFCAWVTDKIVLANWLVPMALLILGSWLFLELNHDPGAFVLVSGLGMLAGTLGVLSADNNSSD